MGAWYVKLKDIKQIKVEAEQLPKDSKEYHIKMAEYHNEMAEHWDAKIGGVTNDDDKCTEEWERHQRLQDEHFNAYKKLGGK